MVQLLRWSPDCRLQVKSDSCFVTNVNRVAWLHLLMKQAHETCCVCCRARLWAELLQPCRRVSWGGVRHWGDHCHWPVCHPDLCYQACCAVCWQLSTRILRNRRCCGYSWCTCCSYCWKAHESLKLCWQMHVGTLLVDVQRRLQRVMHFAVLISNFEAIECLCCI